MAYIHKILFNIAVFLHLISPVVLPTAIPVVAAPQPIAQVIPAPEHVIGTVVVPTNAGTVVAPVVVAPIVIPQTVPTTSNAVIPVLSQDQIDAINATRLQQSQTAASSTALRLAAQAAVIKAAQLADLQSQFNAAQAAVDSDVQKLNDLRNEILATPGYTAYQQMLWNKERAAITADLAVQQAQVQALQNKLNNE